jgi:hypothetical protein
MSRDLDRLESRLQAIAAEETGPEAIRIIDKLSQEIDNLRTDLMYERLETPLFPTDEEVREFKEKFYAAMKGQRATDMAFVYNEAALRKHTPITRLSMVQVLVRIAREQDVKYPPFWDHMLDSRGNF